jgi:Holliday junction resolvasome RuvABC endonuclease subunit
VSFLGIDQSLNATGVCRMNGEGVVTTVATVDPKGARDGDRLLLVKRAIMALATTEVEFAALEGYSYDSVGRVFELGEIGGVVKVLLLEAGIEYVVVPPALVKKFATGNASASKDDMTSCARDAGCVVADDNQADAYFLARIAQAYVRGGATRRCELEVLHTLRNPSEKKSRRRVRRLIKAAI